MFWFLMLLFIVTLLYLFAIMPKVYLIRKKNYKKIEEKMNKKLYAHRGLHNNQLGIPENSLKAFQMAVEAGFGIELDIQLSKDEIPVVFHDANLKRVCGIDGNVEEYSLTELKKFSLYNSLEKIPTLVEVLKLIDGKVPLIIEFKTQKSNTKICQIVSLILDKYKGKYVIESFDPRILYWYRKNKKDIIRGQLSDEFLEEKKKNPLLYFGLKNLLFNFLTRPDFIAYNHKYKKNISRVLCKKIYGNPSVAWTIKTEKELLEAKKNFEFYIFDSFLPKESNSVECKCLHDSDALYNMHKNNMHKC